MSPALSTRFKRLSTIFSIQTARSLHFLVFAWFLTFIVIHVFFVFTTGQLVNLNHIHAGRNDESWIGFGLFAASLVVLIGCWVAATPFTLRHPRVVQRVGQAIVGPDPAVGRLCRSIGRRNGPGRGVDPPHRMAAMISSRGVLICARSALDKRRKVGLLGGRCIHSVTNRKGFMIKQKPQGDFAAGERAKPQGPPRDFAEGNERRPPGPPRDFAEGEEQSLPGEPRNFAETEARPGDS